jgi:hypothetical protein
MSSLGTSNSDRFPLELAEKVVQFIDSSTSLRTVSLLSREFLQSSRKVLFSTITLHCPSQLQPLVDLLKAEQCSIPRVIEKLEIQIRDASYPKPQGRRAIRRIIWRINFILQNIEARSSVSIDLEWMINAYPGWVTEYFVPSSIRLARVGSWSTLCQLTINGHLSRLCNLTAAISQLRSLVVLKVSALWDDDNIPVGGYLSSQLRELEVNTTSLCVLGWINSLPLQQTRGSLRVFKVEAKQELIKDISHLDTFVRCFGSCLIDVSFWMFPRAALQGEY